MAKKMGALYMECSSKEMTGVHEIFDTAINTVVAEQEGLLNPVESNTRTGSRGKTESGTNNGSSANMGGSGGNKKPLVAPSKKKKRSGCKIL